MSLGGMSLGGAIAAKLQEPRPSSLRVELQDLKNIGKASLVSAANEIDEPRKPRPPKPWEDRVGATGNALRAKLPGIDAYDRDLEYHHVSTPKVMLRLERVVGTDRLRINDPKFLSNLSKRIEEEEKKIWKRRVKVRQNAESGRYRQLVIDGIMEPDLSADMQQLRSHPIFRVNRMMKRIKKLSYVAVETTTPASINPTEPFEEQEQTGYLFGSHKNHYLKVHRPKAPQRPSESEEPAEEVERAITASRKSFYGSTLVPGTPTKPNEPEEEDLDFEEEWEENLSRPSTGRPSGTDALADYLRRESLTQARRYLGVDEDEVQKNFETRRTSIVKAVYEEKEQSDEMFDYSAGVLKSYERGQLKTDDFCNKVLRKLMN